LPIEVYTYTKRAMPPRIYAMFTLLFMIVLAVMILLNLMQARSMKRVKQTEPGMRTGLFGRM